MSRRRPRSLLTQVALLSFAALLVAQFVSFWLFTVDRAKRIRVAQRIEVVERVTAVAALLNKTPATARDDLLEAASSRSTRFGVAAAAIVDQPVDLLGADCGQRDCDELGLPAGLRTQEDFVSRRDGGRFTDPPSRFRDRIIEVRPGAGGVQAVAAAARRAVAQRHLALRTAADPVAAAGDGHHAGLAGAGAGGAVVRAAARHPTARSARRGRRRVRPRHPAARMPTGGPREVRALSDALARMHERLARMLAERTRMLAALGHDLRSPITALRVRAEMVDDAENRERIIATLDEMQQMVEATLAFARGVSTDQPTEPVDLAALVVGAGRRAERDRTADPRSASATPIGAAAAARAGAPRAAQPAGKRPALWRRRRGPDRAGRRRSQRRDRGQRSRHSGRPSSHGCSNHSSGSRPRARAKPAAPALACRSRAPSCRRTAPPSPWPIAPKAVCGRRSRFAR